MQGDGRDAGLEGSKVGSIYRSVNAPVDRGKARVGAKIVRGADRASAPVLARAKTAGATYRLWRVQQKVDACDGGFTIQSGGCGEVFEGLDDGEAAALGRLLERRWSSLGGTIRTTVSPSGRSPPRS